MKKISTELSRSNAFMRDLTKSLKPVSAINQYTLWQRKGSGNLLLNPSSDLPFCSILGFIRGLSYNQACKGMVQETRNPIPTYYANWGKIGHSFVQMFMARSGSLKGFWRCPSCDYLHEQVSAYAPCNRCGNPYVEFSEIKLIYEDSVNVRIDGVWDDGEKDWVMDFKFKTPTSLAKVRKETQKVYLRQVKTYAHLLSKMTGKDFSNVMLAFLPYTIQELCFGKKVDNNTHFIWDKVSPSMSKWIDKQVDLLRITRRAAVSCLPNMEQEKLKAGVKKVIQHKCCRDRNWYMDNYYGGYEHCPFAEDGSCFGPPKVLQKNVLDTIKKIVVGE